MKVLVVVDMQNDFIDGALGTPEAQAIVPKVKQKLIDNNGTDTLVLLTKDSHTDDYMNTQEGKNLPVPHCIYMTKGWSLHKEISEMVDDFCKFYLYSDKNIIKSRIEKNTFGSVELGKIIAKLYKKKEINSVELVGLCTDICVISNALLIKAFCPEIPITVDASCCAGVTPESHKNALNAMKMCQINIINEEE